MQNRLNPVIVELSARIRQCKNFGFPCWSIDPTKQTGDCHQTTHSDQHSVAIGRYQGKSVLIVGNDGGAYRRPVEPPSCQWRRAKVRPRAAGRRYCPEAAPSSTRRALRWGTTRMPGWPNVE